LLEKYSGYYSPIRWEGGLNQEEMEVFQGN